MTGILKPKIQSEEKNGKTRIIMTFTISSVLNAKYDYADKLEEEEGGRAVREKKYTQKFMQRTSEVKKVQPVTGHEGPEEE
jgi:hypothetical protein